MAKPIKILDFLGEELVRFEPTDIFHEVISTYAVAACGLMLYRPSTVEILKGIQSIVTIESSKKADIGFDVGEIISHVRDGAPTRDHSIYNRALASVLAIQASRTLEERLGVAKWLHLRQSNPSAEYLRHVRNACAHGARWNFRPHEPSRLAEWRGNRLSREMHGYPLWGPQFTRGDLLLLLWDVEQAVKLSSLFNRGHRR